MATDASCSDGTAGAPRDPADLTAPWLATALGTDTVADFSTERIGTGQLSESHRVALRYASPEPAAPASVVLKVAAADERSRQTGVALGLYEREVRFYAELAPLLGGPVPACYHASFDRPSGTFCLLLGDAARAEQGDEIAGCSDAEAHAAVQALGALHAPALAHPTLAQEDWLNRISPVSAAIVGSVLPGFFERYEQRIAPEHRIVCERLADGLDELIAAAEQLPRGLVHGDYRLDNLLFDLAGPTRPVTVVDWQTVTFGPAMTDLAYFLGCALRTEDRRRLADELIRDYHAGLGGALEYEQCLEGVRRQSFFGVMMAIISPMLVERTERGDEMFMTVLARHAQQVLDSDALALLPPHSGPAPAHARLRSPGPRALSLRRELAAQNAARDAP